MRISTEFAGPFSYDQAGYYIERQAKIDLRQAIEHRVAAISCVGKETPLYCRQNALLAALSAKPHGTYIVQREAH